MSENQYLVSANKRKRVRTIRRNIILTISIIIPYVCCVVLWMKVQNLNNELQHTTNQFTEVSNQLLEQQELLERMREEISRKEEGNPSVDVAEQDLRQDSDVVGSEDSRDTENVLQTEAKHKVHLTFDDGPSIYTDDILDILDQYDIKATFFVTGKEDDASKEALKQIVERGHSLGMHSYSHDYRKIYESLDSFVNDFTKIQDYLYDVTGVKSTIYRFPGGSSNSVSDIEMQEFANYLQSQGVTFYDWNISSGDGGSNVLTVQELVANCTMNVENWNTSIILLHDSADKQTTMEALPIIIENILAIEDAVILPITEETRPVQHISTTYTKEKE